MKEQLVLLPSYLTAHLQLALIALLLGSAISIPLGIISMRHRRLQMILLAITSTIQTIPSLALLAIMVPCLAALNHLSSYWLHFSIQSIGYVPALIALLLYSMLPILRNTITGLQSVDASLKEAARGVGMTRRQCLWQVELPQALPMIVAGVRTATAWVVGMTVLSTPVGAPSLGNFIFTGLQTRHFNAVWIGCAASALLSVVLDVLIRAIEISLQRGHKRLLYLSIGLWIVLYGYTGGSMVWDLRHRFQGTVRIGAKTFTEQYILAEMISAQLRHHTSLHPQVIHSLGSTVVLDALHNGSIDAYVDYSGTLWTQLMHVSAQGLTRQSMLEQLGTYLQHELKVRMGAILGFENTYTLAIRQQDAQRLGITTMLDLATWAPQWRLATDYEFLSRPEWHALKQAYHLVFSEHRSMDPSLMYQAIDEKAVEVITAYTTDARLKTSHLTVLQDPRHVIPPYDAVVLVGPRLSRYPQALKAIGALSYRISASDMQSMNAAVDQAHLTPAAVAEKFIQTLATHP